MKKLPKLKAVHKKAWTLFSRYIRSKDANFDGYTECYTCRGMFQWKEMDAGHRWHNKLDFDPMNIHPQCVRCNKWLHGNLGLYERRLIEEYGLEAVKDLERRAAQHGGYKRHDLLEIIEKYAKKD